MSYHKFVNQRETFNTDLSNTLIQGIGSLVFKGRKLIVLTNQKWIENASTRKTATINNNNIEGKAQNIQHNIPQKHTTKVKEWNNTTY